MDAQIQEPEKCTQKILVVDDSLTVRKGLTGILKNAGFVTCEAENGKDAIEALERQPGVDLILMDLLMPEMDGIEACRIIKSKKTDTFIPILMQTTKDQTHDTVKGLDAGADDYISKKAAPEELVARVKAGLRIKYFHDELKKTHHQLEEAGKVLASIHTVTQIADTVGTSLETIRTAASKTGASDEIISKVDSIWNTINEMLNKVSDSYSSYTANCDEFISGNETVEEF